MEIKGNWGENFHFLQYELTIIIDVRALFQKKTFLETTNFSEKQYSTEPTLSEELLFQNDYFFKRATFQLLFPKRYFLTIHSLRRGTFS